jgi:hypothetical protein
MNTDTPGYQLGINLAFVTRDLMDRPNDVDLLKQMELISTSVRNFYETGLAEFGSDFTRGYDAGRRDMRVDLGMTTSTIGTAFLDEREP